MATASPATVSPWILTSFPPSIWQPISGIVYQYHMIFFVDRRRTNYIWLVDGTGSSAPMLARHYNCIYLSSYLPAYLLYAYAEIRWGGGGIRAFWGGGKNVSSPTQGYEMAQNKKRESHFTIFSLLFSNSREGWYYQEHFGRGRNRPPPAPSEYAPAVILWATKIVR